MDTPNFSFELFPESKLMVTPRDLDTFAAELSQAGDSLPRHINADPDGVEKGLAKLVLTLIELLRQTMERQALHLERL